VFILLEKIKTESGYGMNGSPDAGHLLIRQPIYTTSKRFPSTGKSDFLHARLDKSTLFFTAGDLAAHWP
jgi:hypothetical protein